MGYIYSYHNTSTSCPLLNTTTCPVGNSGKVSFLSHNLQGEATYTCVIPAWERYNGSYFHRILPEAHGSDKPADLFDCATTGDMFLTFTVKLDGIVLTKGVFNKLNENYTKTSIFNMNVPSNNFAKNTRRSYPTGAGGYFTLIKPLPAGEHNLSMTA